MGCFFFFFVPRAVTAGSVAVGLLPTTITCGAPCLRAMGFTGAVAVRDLWKHVDLPGAVTSVAAAVGDNGASVTYKLTAA